MTDLLVGENRDEALRRFDAWVKERREEIIDGRCGAVSIPDRYGQAKVHHAGERWPDYVRDGPTQMTLTFGPVSADELAGYKGKRKQERRKIDSEMRARIEARGNQISTIVPRNRLQELDPEPVRFKVPILAPPKYENPALQALHLNPRIEQMGASILEIKPSGSLIISFDGDLSGWDRHLSHGRQYRFNKHRDESEYSWQTWSLDEDDHDCSEKIDGFGVSYGADVLLVWDDGDWIWDLDS